MFNFLSNIFFRVAEFLVEHLKRRRAAETGKTVDIRFAAHDGEQSGGYAGGETELRHTGGEHALAVLGALVHEETY